MVEFEEYWIRITSSYEMIKKSEKLNLYEQLIKFTALNVFSFDFDRK